MKRTLIFLIIFSIAIGVCACNPKAAKEVAGSETGSELTSARDAESDEMSAETSMSKNSSGTGTGLEQSSSQSSSQYVPSPKNPEKLSAEQENKIRRDWLSHCYGTQSDYPDAYNIDDVSIERYYGSYNGCIAVMIFGDGGYPDAMWDMDVAGIIFHYNSGNRIRIWHNGSIYGLDMAYGQGLLSKDEIRNIAYYHNGK